MQGMKWFKRRNSKDVGERVLRLKLPGKKQKKKPKRRFTDV